MPEAIAAFTSEHLDACTTLFIDVYNSQPWNEHWTYDNARGLLQEMLSIPGFVGVVCVDEELLGFAVGYCERGDEGKRFYLKELVVRPERQRQGVGTRLLQCLESILTKLDVKRVYLITMQAGSAEEFYTKNGYQRSPHRILMLRQL